MTVKWVRLSTATRYSFVTFDLLLPRVELGCCMIASKLPRDTRMKFAAAGLVVLVLLSAGCKGGEEATKATPTLSAQVSPTVLPSPTVSPSPTVKGLFTDPRPTVPNATRSLGEKPAGFPPWDGSSTMVYDVVDGVEMNLGTGSLGNFSPDSTRMVWLAGPDPIHGGEAWMIDLSTNEKRSLGPGRFAAFIDNGRVGIVLPGSNNSEILDLRSGQREPVARIPSAQPTDTVVTPDGYELRKESRSDYPFLENAFVLSDPRTGRLLLEFEAYQVFPAGPRSLVVAMPPVLSGPPDSLGYQRGTVNIFIVDIAAGRAEFVATSAYTPPAWKLAADTAYVLWTDDYCGQPPGKTRLYDRRAGTITELNASLWATFTPDGLIASGAFGARELIDPATLQYTAVIRKAGDVSWSPDYRYASVGIWGGHGGQCG